MPQSSPQEQNPIDCAPYQTTIHRYINSLILLSAGVVSLISSRMMDNGVSELAQVVGGTELVAGSAIALEIQLRHRAGLALAYLGIAHSEMQPYDDPTHPDHLDDSI